MAQPLVVSTPYTLISGDAPPLTSFGPAQQSYTIFNATQNTLKTQDYTSGTTTQNFIEPGQTLIVNQDNTGKWVQATQATTPITAVQINENIQNPAYTLPVASAGLLGGVKIGNNLSITNDGILNAVAGSSASFPTTASLGILSNGTDQTAALNTIFSNPNYKGVILDQLGGGSVTISGTLNGQGKTITFMPGTIFTGTGTINNFILSAGLRQKCFDIGSSGAPTLTVNPIGTTLSVISPWAFGANDGGGDVARYFQATIDCCIRNGAKVSKIYVPTGTYILGSPLICANWNAGGSTYVFHLITIEGENTSSSADGFGTVLNFSSRHNSFGIGIHQGKGCAIKNIKLIGGFNYSFPGAYTFYNLDFTTITDGVSRDTEYSPNAGIVVDPFGATVPTDGGYPGNDAYGVALSTYYRGNNNGSTGVVIEDVFLATWVVGFITSPNGVTANAELVSIWKCQIQNVKIGFASCQSQEKLNIARHIESWGVCGCVFATNLYGAESPGSWWVEDVNIAGFSHTFVNNVQSGYFPSFFSNIYAESLGHFGNLSSNNGTIVQKSTINFAYYNNGGAFCYLADQIKGQGVTFIGCQFRQFGTGLPVVINALNGPLYFRDCSFEAVPIYNQDYALGYCAFSNCVVSNTAETLGPIGLQTVATGSFTNTFAYGDDKIRIGNSFTSTRVYNFKSSIPAGRLPINTAGSNYLVTVTVVGLYHQAVITCGADELNRVFVNDIIVGETNGVGTGLTIVGIVTAAGGGTFTITYIPGSIVSGTHYYLYVWLPLLNIAFTGDVANASNLISNVSIIDGSLTAFVAAGGFMLVSSYTTAGGFKPNLIRLTNWNSGTNTLTVDKNSNATLTKLLFTNTDAVIDPGTPSIAAGAAAGTGPTLSITKGTDKSHQVSILTGTGPATGTLATVTFSLPFVGGIVPSVKFSPANGNAAALNGTTQIFMDSSIVSTYVITTGSAALAATTTYLWNVEVS